MRGSEKEGRAYEFKYNKLTRGRRGLKPATQPWRVEWFKPLAGETTRGVWELGTAGLQRRNKCCGTKPTWQKLLQTNQNILTSQRCKSL